MAQLVEHDLAKVGVAGSSPVSRSLTEVHGTDFRFFVTETLDDTERSLPASANSKSKQRWVTK